jgi:hypothetical protein
MKNRRIEMGEQNIPINIIYSQPKYHQQQSSLLQQHQQQSLKLMTPQHNYKQNYFQNQTFSWR